MTRNWSCNREFLDYKFINIGKGAMKWIDVRTSGAFGKLITNTVCNVQIRTCTTQLSSPSLIIYYAFKFITIAIRYYAGHSSIPRGDTPLISPPFWNHVIFLLEIGHLLVDCRWIHTIVRELYTSVSLRPLLRKSSDYLKEKQELSVSQK